LIPAAIALIATVAGLGLGRYLFGTNATELTSVMSTVLLPPDVRIFPGQSPARSGLLAVSRDGRQIAFTGQTAKGPQIFVRAIDSPVARPVAGTEGGSFPAWSPDGKRLAFWQGLELKQVPSDGGAPQVITEVTGQRSAASWGPDDTLLFHVEYRQGLSRVSAAGGPASDVLPALGDNVSWFSPVWLPDGRRFLVVRFAYSEESAKGAGIYAGSVDSKDVTLLVPERVSEVAIGDQELFYRKGTDLIAQPFDSSSLKLSGNPRVIASHVSMAAAGGPTLVYFAPPGGLSQGHRITWLSRSGAVLSTTGSASTFRDPRISPDELSLAIAQANDSGVFGITKYDIARNIDTRITGTTFVAPAWSRDNRSIIVGDGVGVHRFDASASGAPQMIRTSRMNVTMLDISPDGREAVTRSPEPVKSRLGVMPLDGSSDPRPILADLAESVQAAFSPDGKWLAVAVTEGATARLHVQPHPGPGPKIPVTAMRASYPRWRGDGRELYFLTRADGQAAIMAVPVTWNGGVPDFGPVQTLFKVPNIVAANLAFDVTHDGQKFVVIVAGDLDPSPLTMVVRAVVK
jgi:Tol biopolymer transport system component